MRCRRQQQLPPRSLHPDFQAFPRQAVLCRLAGVEPRAAGSAAAAAFLAEAAGQGGLEARLLPAQEEELPVQVRVMTNGVEQCRNMWNML